MTHIAFAKYSALDSELKSYPYPFGVEYHEVKFKDQNLRMAYMDVKPEGSIKGTVVLLHGKNFSGSYWEKTANDLKAQGYQVIIPDQIGFGKSSKPENFQYTFQALATYTHEILVSKKVKEYFLVGHSMGGMLATRMALMYPKEVKKLLLINPIGLEDWKLKIPYKPVQDIYGIELKTNEEKIREYQKTVYFDNKWKPEYDKGIEIAVGWTLHKEYPRVAWNSALVTDMILTQPVLYEFKNLTMPTLLLIGTRDRTAVGKGWAPADVKESLGRYDLLGKLVIKEISGGELVEMPGLGHMPQVENYSLYFGHLLKFLQK